MKRIISGHLCCDYSEKIIEVLLGLGACNFEKETYSFKELYFLIHDQTDPLEQARRIFKKMNISSENWFHRYDEDRNDYKVEVEFFHVNNEEQFLSLIDFFTSISLTLKCKVLIACEYNETDLLIIDGDKKKGALETAITWV